MRLWSAWLGSNFDLDSFWLVSDLISQGKNVYVETRRYNYGPGWLIVIGVIRSFTRTFFEDSFLAFHLSIAAFLTVIDAGIANWLRRTCGLHVALIFYFHPVSVLISGYHSQFDNVAVLLGLLAWSGFKSTQTSKWLISALWLGLSLVVKHIFLFFPFWLLFLKKSLPLRQRLIFILLAYGIFALSFLPFVFSEAGRQGILQNVFEYKGHSNYVLLNFLLALSVPDIVVDFIKPSVVSKGVFVFLVVASGVIFIKNYEDEPEASPVLYYLVVLFALASATATQYLAIPLVACAVFYKNMLTWCYSLVAIAILLVAPTNIGYFLKETFIFELFGNVQFLHAQTVLLIFLLIRLVARSHQVKL